MTQEDKELLLKDLCARLPYKVYCDASRWTDDKPRQILEVCPFFVNEVLITELAGWMSIEYCRPYLRPMSSMTEQEKEDYEKLCNEDMRQLTEVQELHPGLKNKTSCHRSIDWLLSHYFDYRGLIEKGLALEAPEGMYETEKQEN